MAFAAFTGGVAYYPFLSHGYSNGSFAYDTSSFAIDASGEVVVLVCRAPVAGTIDKLATIVQAVGNTPDNGLRFGLQGVSATTGLQDGTFLETGNAKATVASGSVATGWLESGAFTASHTVTRGELLACVIDIPTFTAGDSVTIRGMSTAQGTQSHTFPYSIRATNTIGTTVLPIILAHYTDGGGFWQQLDPHIMPSTGFTTQVSFDNASAVREAGAVFIPSQPCRLDHVMIPVGSDAAASDFDIILYDSSSNVLDTVSYDGDVQSGAAASSMRYVTHYLSAAVDLTAGSTYRLAVKATTGNNVIVSYVLVPDAAITSVPGQFSKFYYSTRDSGGTWTDYNTAANYRYPTLAFGFSAFSDGAGGGGGAATLVNSGGLVG